MLAGLAAGSDGNPLYDQLATHGVSAEKLARIKIRDLHSELRKWVAEHLDDVRLTRLFFDAEGQLTLICDTPPGKDGEEAQAKVTGELNTRLATYKIPRFPEGRHTCASRQTGPGSFQVDH